MNFDCHVFRLSGIFVLYNRRQILFRRQQENSLIPRYVDADIIVVSGSTFRSNILFNIAAVKCLFIKLHFYLFLVCLSVTSTNVLEYRYRALKICLSSMIQMQSRIHGGLVDVGTFQPKQLEVLYAMSIDDTLALIF